MLTPNSTYHGAPFESLPAAVERYRARASERAASLRAAAGEWTTLYDLSRALFGPRADLVGWLTLSETFYAAASLVRSGALAWREEAGVARVRTL